MEREKETAGMSGLVMKYFVLKPKGNDVYAKASRAAMREYADRIKEENPEFANDIHIWVSDEAMKAAGFRDAKDDVA